MPVRENLLRADFTRQARRALRFFSLFSFFCLLTTTLAGGNIFLNYTIAVEAGTVENIFFTPPPKVYEEIYASFSNEAETTVMRMAFDALPEVELLPSPIARREANQKIGVYIHMNNVANDQFVEREIARLKNLDNSAVVFDVKGSFVYFSSDSEIAKKFGLVKPLYDLPKIVEQFESAGIYTIARVIAAKDPQFAIQNPQAWLTSPWTGQPVPEWVDPADAEVLAYNREIISEIVVAGVDEINLDFMRYPDKFTSAFLGLTGQEKTDNILNFVKMAREAIDSQKMDAVLSVDTFAILVWDFGRSEAALGQDINALVGYADIIAPMLYPATFSRDNPQYVLKGKSHEYSTVFLTLEKYKDVLGKNTKKLRPWIQGYYVDIEQVRDQIEAVFDAGICGFTVWDIQNDYSEAYEILSELKIPDGCPI
ncbi:MAG: putative glycoside hydrolase [Candidatus Peribacteraceae bacterium]|nr:putative glycoside hydrolase [Candidatus Peribacteraceae bacterium]